MKHHVHEWIKVIVAYQRRLLPGGYFPWQRLLTESCPSESLFQALPCLHHSDTVQELCRVLAFQASSTKEIN